MTTVRELHNAAMEKAEEAMIARRQGDMNTATLHFSEAYKLERQALELVRSDARTVKEKEPTRSILARSAGWLAYNAGDLANAEECADIGLNGFPPEPIKTELHELMAAATGVQS